MTTITGTDSGKQRFYRLLLDVGVIALLTLIVTALCRVILNNLFELNLDDEYWYRDYLGNLAVGLIALALLRTARRAAILSTVIVVGFQMANGGKLSVLGTPISPDDFMNIQNLFYLTEGWRRYALMLVAAAPLITLCLLFPYRQVKSWIALVTLAAVFVVTGYFSEPLSKQLDAHFDNSVWNQPENFKERGLALHIVQESVRTMAKVGKYPNRAAVMAATEQLATKPPRLPGNASAVRQVVDDPDPSAPNIPDARNVHIIVLESFFDPLSLGSEWVPEDPLPQSFRDLWAQTENSIAMSPVFGGYTANAEFETLCGFPVTETAVFFEGWLRKSAPCLPAILAEAGYQTIASHPNVPGFWNRTLAYRLVGFNKYLSKSDFDLSDSVDGLLLDHSYYKQVFAHLDQSENPDNPILNYMLTYHGHLPYPSNEHYPDKVKAGKDVFLLNGYLNQLWYKSRDLMEQLDKLKAEDPDALIVVFGDHLPFLGPNFGVYTEALDLPEDRADFTGETLEYLVSTPLIVIDGKNGPLKLGKMPLYRLPSLVLTLLGHEGGDSILEWTANPEEEVIRPVYGMHISVHADQTHACPTIVDASAACAASAQWLTRTRLLIDDLFTGKQFALERLKSLKDG